MTFCSRVRARSRSRSLAWEITYNSRRHEWAELFEKLADLVGRGIRYGEPPLVDPRSGSAEDELGVAIVKLARAIADAIAEVELGDVLAAGGPQRDAHRQSVDKLLIAFRTAVDHLQGR